MSKRGARIPAFSRLTFSRIKQWFKSKTHRANRKRLRQSDRLDEHRDKPLDPWALD